MGIETTIGDKLKAFNKSTNDKAQGILNWIQKSNHRSPIQILKRLQREAFSDIMKLRDRQEKVERLLTYRSSKGNPFQESTTRVKGKVDTVGALFFTDDIDELKHDAIQRSGIRTGIDARLAFETSIRENDNLVAEFIAGEKGPLSLAKVFYKAHVNDWFSAIAIPVGAQCRDFGISHQETALSTYSGFGPPLLNQENGSAVGIIARKSNMVASLAQIVSGTLSTFGQVVWQLPRNTKLSLLGVHKHSRPSCPNLGVGGLALPVSIFKRNAFTEAAVEDVSNGRNDLGGSIAMMGSSELYEGMKIGGWVERKNTNPGQLQWAVTMCDDASEDVFGWGLSLGGVLNESKTSEHFQVETYLNLKLGGKFKLQPGFVYVKEGPTQLPVLMLRSSWDL